MAFQSWNIDFKKETLESIESGLILLGKQRRPTHVLDSRMRTLDRSEPLRLYQHPSDQALSNSRGFSAACYFILHRHSSCVVVSVIAAAANQLAIARQSLGRSIDEPSFTQLKLQA
jgi:hypothetical protein